MDQVSGDRVAAVLKSNVENGADASKITKVVRTRAREKEQIFVG